MRIYEFCGGELFFLVEFYYIVYIFNIFDIKIISLNNVVFYKLRIFKREILICMY